MVVGAGNTAIDAANAARRLGAAHVTIVYRRTENDLPAFGFEYEHAKQEGVVFEWLAQPVAIHTYPAGRIASVECVRMDEAELRCRRRFPVRIFTCSATW